MRRPAAGEAALAAAALGVAALAAACDAPGPVVVAPVVELPVAGSEADPRALVEALELSAAREGEDEDLVARSFAVGEAVELGGLVATDELVVHLSGRTAGSEVAYGRTCAIDARGAAPLAPHLWFARTVRWADFSGPAGGGTRRAGGLAVAAGGGEGVFFGGTDGAAGAPLTGVDVFDPRLGEWRGVAQVAARTGARAAAFGDGTVLVVGGVDAATAQPAGYYERLDATAVAEDRVDRVEDVRLALVDHAAVDLDDGTVLVVGGRAPPMGGGAAVATADTWLFALGDGGALELPRRLPVGLPAARSGHTATRLSDEVGAPVLIAGGAGADGLPVAAAALYQPPREAFAAAFAPPMVVPRAGHAAVRLPDGSVLVIGGLDDAGAPVAALEVFSLAGGFVAAGALPVTAGLVDLAVTPLPDGRVLLSGGRRGPGEPALATAFIARLDPVGGTVDVVPTDGLSHARAGHQAVRLCDGTILVVGGAATDVAAERYNPPSGGRR